MFINYSILLILAVLSLKRVLNHDFHWTNAHKYYREKQIVTHQGPLFQYWKESPRKTKCSPELLSCIDSMNTMILSGTISNRIVLCIKATISRHIWVKLEIQMSLNVVDTFAVLCIIEEDVKPRFSLNQCTQVLQRETDSYSSRAAIPILERVTEKN